MAHFEGVTENKRGQFIVQIGVDDKQRFVGRFSDIQAANDALQAAKASAEAAAFVESSPEAISWAEADEGEGNVESAVQEAIRNLVCRVVSQDRRPAPTSHYERPVHSARLCRFGNKCRRGDVIHWQEADHPADHPKLGQAAPPPPAFSLESMLDCHHWKHKGFCSVSDDCLFVHNPKKRGESMMPGVNHRIRANATWKTRGRRNGSRGAVFRRFLIDTFGIENLASGSGVLDVAGGGAGGGGLAFQLLNYNGIPSTIIDPRPPINRKAIDMLAYTGAHRANPMNAKYDTDVTTKGDPARSPPFILRLVEEVVVSAEMKQEQVDSSGAKGGGDELHPGADYDVEVKDDKSIREILASCSVVCGLHSDGATEPLVDFAIANGKPFAVVPCCVFWRSNPNLLGAGVRKYDEFLDHLAAKLPPGEVKRGTLGFDGRNTVLWWEGRVRVSE